jgi:LytS/YehU family sensor histidine kinase
MLEAQIEPQFLFNTLANVQQLVRTDTTRADRLLVQLVSYLRQAIPDVRGSASTLGREFELARTYLDIVQVRIGERLTVSVACEPALAQTPFPSLVVHTLLENAVRHGIDNRPGPVSIAVRARLVKSHIEIQVEDNGAGFGAGPAVGPGLGLRNVRDRLELAYHGQAQLDVTERDSGGVCATVRIPACADC